RTHFSGVRNSGNHRVEIAGQGSGARHGGSAADWTGGGKLMKRIALNARFYSHRPTGMQRYGVEMAQRMADELEVLRPRRPLRGAEGHMWEQAWLAGAARGRLLWSPNNTGPLAVARQICTMH